MNAQPAKCAFVRSCLSPSHIIESLNVPSVHFESGAPGPGKGQAEKFWTSARFASQADDGSENLMLS